MRRLLKSILFSHFSHIMFSCVFDTFIYKLSCVIRWRLEPCDWLEAFSAHPRIGDESVLRSNIGSKEKEEQAGAETASQEGSLADIIYLFNLLYSCVFSYLYCQNTVCYVMYYNFYYIVSPV